MFNEFEVNSYFFSCNSLCFSIWIYHNKSTICLFFVLVQLTQPYGSQPNSLVAPPSPLTQAFTQTTSPSPDLGYLQSSRAGLAHDGHIAATAYHSTHAHHHPSTAQQQSTFGHGMPQVGPFDRLSF